MNHISQQRALLPYLIARITEIDPHCGIMLQGSVSRGTERSDSDLDLTVVFGDVQKMHFNELIRPDNQFGMSRVVVQSINIDINWYYATDLKRILQQDGACDFFIFSLGEIVHDPLQLASSCQSAARAFFTEHPLIAAAWEKQNEAVRRSKSDPLYKLEYPRWPAFSKYLLALLQSETEIG